MYSFVRFSSRKGVRMKRVLAVLVTVFLAVCLFVSCDGEDPFFVSVSFDSNGGSKVKRQGVYIGETAEKPSAPTREGYDFQCWLHDGVEYDFSTPVTEDITLKALWKAQKRTVKFDSNGGTPSTYADIDSYYDAYIAEPAAPKKSGLSFMGWYNGDTKYDFSAPLRANVTLKAKWGYKVTFDADNGEAPVYVYLESAGTIAEGTVADPEKEKFAFDGWYTDPENEETKFEFGKTEVTADGLKLTAKWKPTYTCIVNYNRTEDGIPNDYYEVIDGYKFHFTDSDSTGSWDITELAKKYNVGYKFVGWYYDGVLYEPGSELWKNKEIIVKQPVTLTAAWEDKTTFHTVSFLDDDGKTSLLSKAKVEDGKTVYIPEDWAPHKDGWVFDCWTKDGVKYDTSAAVKTDITLTASWKAVKNVTFKVDGVVYAVKEVGEGDTVSAPGAPTKDGYTFMGWYIGDNEYDFNSAVTANIELTAKWGYRVSFMVTGAADSYTVPDVQEVVETGTATKPDSDPVSSFVGDNKYKTFAYWSLDGETEYDFSTKIKANITLKAVWRDLTIKDRGPAGGWIFYDKGSDSNGWRYLELADKDLDKSYKWFDDKTVSFNPGTGTAIGDGKQNTDNLTYNTGVYLAAAAAKNWTSNGYGDWFLPSRDELGEAYSKLEDVAGFHGNCYWTSSWKNYQYIYCRDRLGSDESAPNTKYHVRCARRF